MAGGPSVNVNFGKETVPFESCLEKGNKHGVHAMIWAKWSNKLVIHKYEPKAAILMQVRFDGHLGFPGGKVDEDLNVLPVEQAKEKALEGLVRELKEEININELTIKFNLKDYLASYRHPTMNYCLHFYTKEVSLSEFEELERDAMKSEEFGDEVMGNFRVPLYTMDDGYRGLPAFLNNAFIGTAKEELLAACAVLDILSVDYIQEAMKQAELRGVGKQA